MLEFPHLVPVAASERWAPSAVISLSDCLSVAIAAGVVSTAPESDGAAGYTSYFIYVSSLSSACRLSLEGGYGWALDGGFRLKDERRDRPPSCCYEECLLGPPPEVACLERRFGAMAIDALWVDESAWAAPAEATLLMTGS